MAIVDPLPMDWCVQVVLHKDARIVVRHPLCLSDEVRMRIRARVSEWSGVRPERVLVLSEGMDFAVVNPE